MLIHGKTISLLIPTLFPNLIELHEVQDCDVDDPRVGRGVLVPLVGLGLGAERAVGVRQRRGEVQQPRERQGGVGGRGVEAVEAGPLVA